MNERRFQEIDAATGAVVNDMRFVLGWVAWGIGTLTIIAAISMVTATTEDRWFMAVLYLVATGFLGSAWWDAMKRASKYGKRRKTTQGGTA